MLRLLDAVVFAMVIVGVAAAPAWALAFPRPRPRRMTIASAMAIVAVLALNFAVLARAFDLRPAVVSISLLCLWALPFVLAKLYLPTKRAEALLVAWIGFLLGCLTLLACFAAHEVP